MSYDTKLALRAASAGSMTASEQSATFVDYGGPDRLPVTYLIHVPKASGTSPKLDVKIQESTDGTNPLGDEMVAKQITAAGDYYVTFRSNNRYRRMYTTVAGTGADFGAVIIAPVPAGIGFSY